MTDNIHRLSGELARDPSSFVFLELGEALRQDGALDVAIKIGARGIERHPAHAEAHALVARIETDRRDYVRARAAWETVLRLAPENLEAMKGLQSIETAVPADSATLFADLLVDDGQTALLLDSSGYVLGGLYLNADGDDLGQEIGAQLSGISDEVVRATRHLDIGEWRSILFETQVAVVALAPAPDESLLVVVASRSTPLGLLRRLLGRCAQRSAAWLGRGGDGRGSVQLRDER